jgi:hypothetical protein
MAAEKTKRVLLLMTPSELQALDDWRSANQVWSRGKAIRELVERGIKPAANAAGPQAIEPRPNQASAPRVDVPETAEPSPTQAQALRARAPSSKVKRVVAAHDRSAGSARSDMPTQADLAAAVDDEASQLGVVHLGSVEDLRKGLNRADILRPFLNRGVPRSRLVRWFDQSVIAFNIAMSAPTP